MEEQLLKLRTEGLVEASVIQDSRDIADPILEQPPRLLFLDLDMGENGGLSALRRCRSLGYAGLIVVLTSDPSLEDLYTAAAVGADDYLLKGRKLDLAREARYFATCSEADRHLDYERDPSSVSRLRLFDSLGLGRGDVELLVDFARDFPRLSELADRLGQQYPVLRKRFSRIYGKLRDTFAIDNQAQLAYFFAICERLRRPRSTILFDSLQDQPPHGLER